MGDADTKGLRWLKRSVRAQFLGSPVATRHEAVGSTLSHHVNGRYASLLSYGKALPVMPLPGMPVNLDRCRQYIRRLGIAAAWECFFDVIMMAVTVAGAVTAGIAAEANGLPPTISVVVALAVLVTLWTPSSPMTVGTPSSVLRIVLVTGLAFAVHLATPFTFNTPVGPANATMTEASMLISAVSAGSIVGASALSLLFALRLLRYGTIDRLLNDLAQETLTLELLAAGEMLSRLGPRVDWRADAEARIVRSQLHSCAVLIKSHSWFPTDLLGDEHRSVSANMRRHAEKIMTLRQELLNAGDDTILDTQKEVFRTARLVYAGRFGALSGSTDAPPGLTAVQRVRRRIVPVLYDLPLAVLPFVVIRLYSLMGLPLAEGQVVTLALTTSAIGWTTYVIARAIDPKKAGDMTLTSFLLQALRTALGAKDDSKSEASKTEPPHNDSVLTNDKEKT